MFIQRRYCGTERPPGYTLGQRRAPRVTGLAARKVGSAWILTATVEIAPPYYCYWLLDGHFFARTTGPTLQLSRTGTANVSVLVSRRGALDAANWRRIPRTRRRTLEWLKSGDDVDSYRCEYAEGQSGGTWTEFAEIEADGRWSYQVETLELADLTWYRFRVTPVKNDNDGTPVEWPAEFIVRIPDTPAFTVSFDDQTGYVTFEAA